MEQNERKSSGINIGSASIIMVFSVLCLTVFAVLTFITANSEYKQAVNSADSIKNYYAADTAATEKMAALKAAVSQGNGDLQNISSVSNALGVKTEKVAEGVRFSFDEKVDEKQKLSVELIYNGTDLKIEKWKLIADTAWQGDTGTLWDGEF